MAVSPREGEGGHVVRIDLHVGGTCRTSIGGLSFLFSPNLTYLEQRKLGFYQTHKGDFFLYELEFGIAMKMGTKSFSRVTKFAKYGT